MNPSRLLGLDFGEKYIGVAISTNKTAFPYVTIINKSKKTVKEELERIIQEESIQVVIIGLPLSVEAGLEKLANRVLEFGSFLEKNLSIEVCFQNETLTTVQAYDFLKRSGASFKKQKAKVHEFAAQIILQEFLDSH